MSYGELSNKKEEEGRKGGGGLNKMRGHKNVGHSQSKK